MTLTDDEASDLRLAFDTGWLTLYAHVTELVTAYHAQGLVMGDLAHDATIRAEAGA